MPSIRRNRFQGKTASLTEIPFAIPSPLSGNNPLARNCGIVTPDEIKAALFASGFPVALLTKGTVREARGFASKT